MASGQRPRRGGILGLWLEVLSDRARRRALQYDLLRAGLSLDDLGSEALSWFDLASFVTHAQTRPDSELATVVHGYRLWTVAEQLAAHAADLVAAANWQRAGKRSAPKPSPIERPWLKDRKTTLGRDPIPVSQFNDWWDSRP